MHWRSSNSYLLYNINDTETPRIKQFYKINTGIDTLFANGLRTRLELTNQDKQLDSQVLIKHAIIDYSFMNFSIETAIKDYGYGNDFLLYNRRNDDILFHENILVNYRWHGLEGTYNTGNQRIGAGFAGNELNQFLSNVFYMYEFQNLSVIIFGVYSHKDNQYTLPSLDAGTEFMLTGSQFKLRTDFDYHIIPKSKNFPAMKSWQLINEVKINLSNWADLILSVDLTNQYYNKNTDHVFESCLELNSGKVQAYLGLREQNLFSGSALTSFLDLNYYLQKNFYLGVFSDFIISSDSNEYFKFGVQTIYALD